MRLARAGGGQGRPGVNFIAGPKKVFVDRLLGKLHCEERALFRRTNTAVKKLMKRIGQWALIASSRQQKHRSTDRAIDILQKGEVTVLVATDVAHALLDIRRQNVYN